MTLQSTQIILLPHGLYTLLTNIVVLKIRLSRNCMLHISMGLSRRSIRTRSHSSLFNGQFRFRHSFPSSHPSSFPVIDPVSHSFSFSPLSSTYLHGMLRFKWRQGSIYCCYSKGMMSSKSYVELPSMVDILLKKETLFLVF